MSVDLRKTLKAWRVREVFLCVFAIGLLTHAFCYFSISYTHDSLLTIYSERDMLHQMEIGRYLQPAYYACRGGLNVPWLNGVLSLLYLGGVVCLLGRILPIRKNATLLMAAALMVTTPALISMNATYIEVVDVFMFAMLAATFSVWLMQKYRFGWLAGALCLFVSLALYQSYLAFACGLLLLRFIIMALEEKADGRTLTRYAAQGTAMITAGGGLYAAGYWAMKHYLNVQGSMAYNGIETVGDYTNVSRLQLVKDTYKYVWYEMSQPDTAHSQEAFAVMLVLLMLGLAAMVCVVAADKSAKPMQLFMSAAALVVLPFALNITFFITKGMAHELMTYAFVLLPIFALLWLERVGECQKIRGGYGVSVLC